MSLLQRAISLFGACVGACGLAAVTPGVADFVSRWGVYGVDDRAEWYQTSVGLRREVAPAIALLVSRGAVTREAREGRGVSVPLSTATFGEQQELCAGENFWDQPAWGECTGFWVGADHLITAGHCVTNTAECENTQIVFDFHLTGPDTWTTEFGDESVFRCVEVIHTQSSENDFAVLRLDRVPSNRRSLKMGTGSRLVVGDQVVMAGHPSGLPLKFSGPAAVSSVGDSLFFSAPLDHLGGSSGSPVIHLGTGLVEGILVAGYKDYSFVSDVDSGQTCHVQTRYAESDIDHHAFVARIGPVVSYLFPSTESQ